jgi:hypothetical protein
MTEIYNNCKKLGIAPPDSVYNYFGDDVPAEEGVKINLEQYVKNIIGTYDTYDEIYQVNLKEVMSKKP